MKKKHLRNALLLGSLTTATAYGLNQLIKITSTAGNLSKSSKGETYDWKYGKIFYTKQGEGFPVLLVHDLDAAASSYEWHNVIDQLSKTHTVYAIDLLGCGKSDKPNITYINFLYVQLLYDFVHNVIGEEADIIATGDSASFTIMANNMHPDMFHDIILVNPSLLEEFSKMPSKKNNIVKYLIDAPVFGTLLYNLITCKCGIEKKLREKYYHNNKFVPKTVVDYYYESAHIGTGKFLLSSIESHYTNINISHALQNMQNDITLVLSTSNPDKEKIVETYRECNPSIHVTNVSDSKRLPQLEEPKKFLDAISDILEEEDDDD